EELNIVQSYLNIEQVRIGERLEVAWEIEASGMVDIPFLSIQPLVENAINHGIMARMDGGKVVISANDEESQARISGTDNGVGIVEVELVDLLNRKTNDRSSVGLINTNQRIFKDFGQGLQIESTLGKGTTVSFIVPK